MTETQPEAQAFVRPMNGMVVFLPLQEERVANVAADGLAMDVRISEGGIAIPDVADLQEIEGLVVATGESVGESISEYLVDALVTIVQRHMAHPFESDRPALAAEIRQTAAELRKPMDVQVGMKILVQGWHATTISLGDLDFNIVDESAIIGIVTDAETTSESSRP